MATRRGKQQLTLDRPVTYQIKVPGHLDEHWTEWNGKMTVSVGYESDGPPFTILTGVVDQAALHGLLRQLYGLGLPLISVLYIDPDAEDAGLPNGSE